MKDWAVADASLQPVIDLLRAAALTLPCLNAYDGRGDIRFVTSQQDRQIEVLCPCCGARLRIDATLGRVISHDKPQKLTKAPELTRATDLLQEQAAQREAHFKKSAEEEKIKSQVLERKFAEAMKKTKSEPAAPPPLRDIDLD